LIDIKLYLNDILFCYFLMSGEAVRVVVVGVEVVPVEVVLIIFFENSTLYDVIA